MWGFTIEIEFYYLKKHYYSPSHLFFSPWSLFMELLCLVRLTIFFITFHSVLFQWYRWRRIKVVIRIINAPIHIFFRHMDCKHCLARADHCWVMLVIQITTFIFNSNSRYPMLHHHYLLDIVPSSLASTEWIK